MSPTFKLQTHTHLLTITLKKPSSRKVSAAALSSNLEPKLHEHHLLPPADKEIWDKSYTEEYLGLHEETQTWEYISEEEYKTLPPTIGNDLPTMAISKIKPDADGNPICAKYHIIVLGNLDPHSWTSADCFAPVISSLELRILLAIATQMKHIPKTGDVSQAFVQSVLPPDEKYVFRPPKGCHHTPSNTYLFLCKTLYGLKRSLRHWYETVKKTFAKLGLFPCPNAPCLFTGTINDGEPPLYLGLFVDDFIFFNASDTVKQVFQTRFAEYYKVDFQQELTHFLGIKFKCTHLKDGELETFMNQPSDIRDLITKAGLDDPSTITKPTPYHSGHPVDSVPNIPSPPLKQQELNKKLQELVGSLNWIGT